MPEPPETRAAPTSPPEAGSAALLRGDPARDAFQALEKARKLRRLYDDSHRLRREADEELTGKFRRALEAEGTLHLDVGPDAIELDGRPLLEGRRTADAIPYSLYRDGVRTLTIRPEVEDDELRRFAAVLDFGVGATEHFDEDLVTLLWREDFRHIEYLAVDATGVGEDNAGKVGTASRPDEMERRVEEIAAAILSARPSDPAGEAGAIRVAADREDLLRSERRALAPEEPTDRDLGFLSVPEATLTALREEDTEGEGTALLERALAILFDLVKVDADLLEPVGVTGIFRQLLRSAVARGDLALAARILVETEVDPGGPLGDLPGGLAAELSRPETLRGLSAALRDGAEPAVLGAILARIPAENLPYVVGLACRLSDPELAAVCRETVLARGEECPDALLALLDGLAPEEAGAILATTLSRSGREEADRLLARMLEDARPGVRRAACTAIEEGRLRDLLPVLIGVVESGRLEGSERVPLVHAVAVLGGPLAVAFLKEQLGPRLGAGLRSRRSQDARHEAILALSDVEDPSVRNFLAAGCASRDKRFARACREALARRRGGVP